MVKAVEMVRNCCRALLLLQRILCLATEPGSALLRIMDNYVCATRCIDTSSIAVQNLNDICKRLG
jgi:hypothetical protein